MNAPGNRFRDWNFSLQEETHEGIKKKRDWLGGEKFDSWKKNAPGNRIKDDILPQGRNARKNKD